MCCCFFLSLFVCLLLYCSCELVSFIFFLATNCTDEIKLAKINELMDDTVIRMNNWMRDKTHSLDLAVNDESSQVDLAQMTSTALIDSMSDISNQDVLSSLSSKSRKLNGVTNAYKFGKDLICLLRICKDRRSFNIKLPKYWETDYKPITLLNGVPETKQIRYYGDITNSLIAADVLGKGVDGKLGNASSITRCMNFAKIITDFQAEKFVVGFGMSSSWHKLVPFVTGSWLIRAFTRIAPTSLYCTPVETSSGSGSSSGSGRGSSSSSSNGSSSSSSSSSSKKE